MNILISGATGFIGAYLLKSLLNDGHRCRCLVRRLDNLAPIFHRKNVELYLGDVTDINSLNEVGKDIDAAYHLAGAGHVAAVSGEVCREAIDINVKGTINFAKACAIDGVKRLIHFSSTAAMGLIKASKLDEKTSCHPKTPYQKSKYLGEIAAVETGKKFGMETIVLRPCMVFGPGGRGEFFKFCRLINLCLFPRIGLGENLTPIVYVRDVVQAAVKALYGGRTGEAYVIASKNSLPLKNIHQYICLGLNIRRPYFYVPTWIAYLTAFFIENLSNIIGKEPVVSRMNITSTITGRTFDIRKAMDELSYRPETALNSAIASTAKYFKKKSML